MLKSTAGDAWGFETANVIDSAATAAVEAVELEKFARTPFGKATLYVGQDKAFYR
jgi:hypothetical protein